HPASLPDLNPIEPVWLDLKNILRHLRHPPNTADQLKVAIMTAWDEIPMERIDKHIGKIGE
ncbi:hypothetical protein BJ912DRAFT_866304, partial [Pholiota molesta]